MKLRPEYEHLTYALMGRMPSPTLDVFLNELLHEEERLLTRAHLVQQKQ